MSNDKPKLGIVVGGGPAPGINSVIGAATISAINHGLEVIGFYDGFKWLVKGDTTHTSSLTIKDVSRIHLRGGSILNTSRKNLLEEKEGKMVPSPCKIQRVRQALDQLGIHYLVTIGGDDTAFSASLVSKEAGGKIKIAHVPKTIDNDLPLPGHMPTFGFQTARQVGTELVANLMEDARTAGRWYFVVAMGRSAGHLALGMGAAAGATVTLIPEEFPQKPLPFHWVCDVLEGAILKRKALGREDGVAVIAEGVGYKMDPQELQGMPGVEIKKDAAGHLRMAEVPLANLLRREVMKRLKDRELETTIVGVDLGYELRCAPPNAFDLEYTRALGCGAIRYLLQEADDAWTDPGAMISLQGGQLVPIPFSEILDPETGKTQVRKVDTNADSYSVARELMIRLERSDFEDEAQLQKLSEAAKMSVEDFQKQFGPVVGLG